MSLGGGLLLMGLVFLACWVAFTLVSEFIIRRERRAGADGEQQVGEEQP